MGRVHHVIITRLQRNAGRQRSRDTCGHAFTAPGINKNDPVGTFGPVKGCPVAQHRHPVDVRRVDVGQDVVVEAVVKHLPAVLLVQGDSVYHDKRLCVGIDGVQPVHHHHSADAGSSVPHHGAHARSQFALYVLFYRQGRRVVETFGHAHVQDVGLLAV